MGKYRSDSSDESYSRKSKKKRSRSSSSEKSHISDSKRKKSRRKQRRSSRSWSRSADKKASRSSRRSRSASIERYSSRKRRSVSRSSDRRGSRRSRSPPSKRGRSRSPPPRRRRSYSRSRSTSRERRRDSRSQSRERSSFAGDRIKSERTSTDKHKGTGQVPGSPRFKGTSTDKHKGTGQVPGSPRFKGTSTDKHKGTGQVPGSPRFKGQLISESASGFSDMTPSEQAEERMRQALKAAAAAGEKLKGHTVVDLADSRNFVASVAAIESNSFVASSFKSSRLTKVKEEVTDSGLTHDDAIFGSLAISGFTLAPDLDTKPIQLDSDTIMHPSLYCDPQEKMEKWISRLSQLRRRKLEGEVMQ